MSNVKVALKSVLLPTGTASRRLPMGIGRGINLGIDFGQHTKLYVGLYEVELNPHLRRLCRPGMTVFDVGAQHGYDALVFAKLTRSSGKIVTFECDEKAIPGLRRNIAANARYAGQIILEQAFVSISTDEGTDRLSLDHAAMKHGVPSLIKLDIEGAEADALVGAEQLLSENRPSIVIETHGKQVEDQCLSILDQHGYTIELVNPRRWLPDRRLIAHNRWVIATHPWESGPS